MISDEYLHRIAAVACRMMRWAFFALCFGWTLALADTTAPPKVHLPPALDIAAMPTSEAVGRYSMGDDETDLLARRVVLLQTFTGMLYRNTAFHSKGVLTPPVRRLLDDYMNARRATFQKGMESLRGRTKTGVEAITAFDENIHRYMLDESFSNKLDHSVQDGLVPSSMREAYANQRQHDINLARQQADVDKRTKAAWRGPWPADVDSLRLVDLTEELREKARPSVELWPEPVRSVTLNLFSVRASAWKWFLVCWSCIGIAAGLLPFWLSISKSPAKMTVGLHSYWLHTARGTVIHSDRWTENHAHNASAAVTDPRGSVVGGVPYTIWTTRQYQRIFLRSQSGVEWNVTLTQNDLPVRPGHTVTVFQASRGTRKSGHYLYFHVLELAKGLRMPALAKAVRLRCLGAGIALTILATWWATDRWGLRGFWALAVAPLIYSTAVAIVGAFRERAFSRSWVPRLLAATK